MQLSEAEWRLMNALWRAAPATARDVHGEVVAATGWAYTTVKTMLDRLVDKGALRAKLSGNQSVYSPAVTQERARRSAVQALVARAFDGELSGLVHHVADDAALSAKERAELESLLAKLERKAKP
jgi:predicted transcriptional regulator